MPVYYFDTSALVKRYASEVGTAWVVSISDPAAKNDLYTVRLTGPEMIAAFFRKVRTGDIRLAEATRLASDFRADWRGQYQIVEISAGVADRAMALAERYNVRGYDAVHLAAAMELQALRRAMRLSLLTFVSADENQLGVASAEGLATENPNHHL
jgi:predicted nucleic acid-binding protein